MHPARVNKFSAYFPGALCALVEKEMDGPLVFFSRRAAGDLSANPGPDRDPEKFGEKIGRDVLAPANAIRCEAPNMLTLQTCEDDFRFSSRVDFGNVLVQQVFVRAFFRELVDFYLKEYRDGVRPHLTTALLDGRIGFVGVSGEFFCGHALNLNSPCPARSSVFSWLLQRLSPVFPTIEAAAEGGYGADPQVSPVELGAGERMMDRR